MDERTVKDIGALIKEKRKQKKLTQRTLAKMAGCSLRTIQRIESGYSNTHQHTIQQILPILDISREEFNSICYGADISMFYSDVERIWDKGLSNEYDIMSEMVDGLKEKYGTLDRPIVKQVILLLDGAVLHNKVKDYPASLATMYEALKITATDIISDKNVIDCRKVSGRIFSLYEYRILRFVAALYGKLGERKQSLELNGAIVVSLEKDTSDYGLQKKLIPVTCFNLSNGMIDTGAYTDGLEFAQKGIDFCKQTKEYKHLGDLLWNKGKALYRLGDIESATALFQESFDFFVSTKEHERANLAQTIAKENYKITLL